MKAVRRHVRLKGDTRFRGQLLLRCMRKPASASRADVHDLEGNRRKLFELYNLTVVQLSELSSCVGQILNLIENWAISLARGIKQTALSQGQGTGSKDARRHRDRGLAWAVVPRSDIPACHQAG